MFKKIFKKCKIQAPFSFETEKYCFGFERSISEALKKYIILNAEDWIKDMDACSFRWHQCFDNKITLSFWDDKYIPKGIVTKKSYIKKLDGEISLDGYFDQLPTISIPIKTLWEIFYKFVNEFNYSSLWLTEHCNIKCTMCFFHGENFKTNRKKTRCCIDNDAAFSFIDQVADHNLLISASGEILLHPHALELIQYAAKKNNATIVIGTNGLLFNSILASKILDLGIYEVNFSVDSINPDQYESIRIGSSFSKVVDNIIYLRKLRDEGKYKTRITINCILFDENISIMEEIKNFWRGKADAIAFLSKRQNYHGLNTEMHRFTAINDQMCLSPFLEGPVLNPEGLIFPCCQMAAAEWFERFPWIYNIKDTSVKTAMSNYRKMMLDNTSSLRAYCKNCNFWIESFQDDAPGLYKSYILD